MGPLDAIINEKPICVLINPNANEGRALEFYREKIKPPLDKHNRVYHEKITESPEYAVDFVRSDKEHLVYIIVSGDTGSNAAAEGAVRSELEKYLVFPGGGIGCDIPKTFPFNINHNSGELCHQLSNASIKREDMWEVNGLYFLAYAGLGYDSIVLDEWKKKRILRGKPAYFAAAFRALSKYKPREMTIKFNGEDGAVEKDLSAFLIVASNVESYAGGAINFSAEPDDGLLDFHVISDGTSAFMNFLSTRLGGQIDKQVVYSHRVRELEVFCREPVPLQVNGEKVPLQESGERVEVHTAIGKPHYRYRYRFAHTGKRANVLVQNTG